MLLSLIEAFLVVICTNVSVLPLNQYYVCCFVKNLFKSPRKLKKSVSAVELTRLDSTANESVVPVPSLLKASVYMDNNEVSVRFFKSRSKNGPVHTCFELQVLFPKDFISAPPHLVEFLRIRTEPSITKLDANNRWASFDFNLQLVYSVRLRSIDRETKCCDWYFAFWLIE